MLIAEVHRDGSFDASLYDAETQSMIHWGRVKFDKGFEGWTLSKFDWEAFIESER